MCPKNASYYGNRAATLMMLYRYREALEDSQQAVRLDNDFMKVDCGKQTRLWIYLSEHVKGTIHSCYCVTLLCILYIVQSFCFAVHVFHSAYLH